MVIMKTSRILSSFVFAQVLFVASAAFAQSPGVEFPAPSPACTLKQRVGLTDIEIVYSRPGAKDRQIFGGLVPYGAVWRTGANQATKITFSTPVKFNGADVPAGTYGLFSIPGEKEWTVILNQVPAQWGAYQYDEKKDLLRVKATPSSLAEHVETFLIELNDIRDESATLILVWEHTIVPVKIEVELAGKLVPQIETTMAAAGGKKPYYQAAMFYYDHGQDLQKARKWIDAAVAEREAFYVVHLKAKILAKLGDKEGAIAAAKRSTELAVKAEGPKSGYVKMNDDLIASLK
jgi:hypothetical protein